MQYTRICTLISFLTSVISFILFQTQREGTRRFLSRLATVCMLREQSKISLSLLSSERQYYVAKIRLCFRVSKILTMKSTMKNERNYPILMYNMYSYLSYFIQKSHHYPYPSSRRRVCCGYIFETPAEIIAESHLNTLILCFNSSL